MSGSGINWAICKPAPRSRQITTPAPHHSVFYRPDALTAAQPTASEHCHKLKEQRYNVYASAVHFMGRRRHYDFDLSVHLCVRACMLVEACFNRFAVNFFSCLKGDGFVLKSYGA